MSALSGAAALPRSAAAGTPVARSGRHQSNRPRHAATPPANSACNAQCRYHWATTQASIRRGRRLLVAVAAEGGPPGDGSTSLSLHSALGGSYGTSSNGSSSNENFFSNGSSNGSGNGAGRAGSGHYAGHQQGNSQQHAAATLSSQAQQQQQQQQQQERQEQQQRAWWPAQVLPQPPEQHSQGLPPQHPQLEQQHHHEHTQEAAAIAGWQQQGLDPTSDSSMLQQQQQHVRQQQQQDVQQQQQQQQQEGEPAELRPGQLPLVPWALNTTITLMVVWLLCFWMAAYSLVPALLRLAGVEGLGSASGGAAATADAAAAAAWAQALRHLILDGLQVLTTAVLLRRGLTGYHPRRLGLFAAPWRPLRRWVPAVVAGTATFPLIDWVHKRMVSLLAMEEQAVSATAEQILGTSSWGTRALWFGVLAVCAPVWEEVVFRGFLLPSLARYLPQWGAVAATSFIFAMVHFSREGLLPLLLLGCVFGVAYAATCNLLAPIALHSLWNVCLLVQLLRSGGM